REWVEPVEKARYRMQVRLATVERLRSLLIRVAGRVYLEERASPAEWAAFERLISCEDFSLEEATGPIPSRLERPEPYPSLDDDIELSTRAAPGWIGIAYRRSPAVPPGITEHPKGTVLVTNVYSGSPADRAGIAVGDLLLGPPGRYFEWANEIRDWTMLSPPDEHRELDLLRGREVVTISIQTDPFPERRLD
ncbi:MAG: PDZ domain-containing protein, partial [Myxococcota bacterium]